MDQTEKLILEAIDQHRDEIIEFARDIYDHGELGYKEFNTAEKFIKKMKELGLRTETGLAITGTKAYLNEEKKDTAEEKTVEKAETYFCSGTKLRGSRLSY